MNRPALRFLAVGFLVSALVLSGYRLFLYEPSTSTAKSSETAKKEKTLSADEKSYKEKYEELLTKVELEKVTGDSSSTDSSKLILVLKQLLIRKQLTLQMQPLKRKLMKKQRRKRLKKIKSKNIL